MDFYDVLEARRSVRSYCDKPVPADSISRIARAVQVAPTACNRQPVQILLVRDPVLKAKLCDAAVWPFLKEAPIAAVLIGNASAAWTRPEGDSIIDVDASIVMEHFVLAAAAEGLGTCWICSYDRAKVDASVGILAPWRSIALSPLGFGRANSTRPRNVKPAEELVKVIG